LCDWRQAATRYEASHSVALLAITSCNHQFLLIDFLFSLEWRFLYSYERYFFSLGMATVLSLMFNHVTNWEIFGKHFNYGMGIPVISMCIEEENHWFSILKPQQCS
jgi:hypothetical protein